MAAQARLSPTVIRGVRWKAGLAAAGSFGFVALGVWLMGQERWDMMLIGGLSALFFAVCGVFGLAGVLRPAELRLDADGFELRSPLRAPARTAWRDVRGFYVWSRQGTRLVAWVCEEERRPRTLAAALNRGLGMDGALPSGWPVRPEALAAMMEDWRSAAAGP